MSMYQVTQINFGFRFFSETGEQNDENVIRYRVKSQVFNYLKDNNVARRRRKMKHQSQSNYTPMKYADLRPINTSRRRSNTICINFYVLCFFLLNFSPI